MPTAAQRRYWSRLIDRGCLICRGHAEIAHAHGGSIVVRMQEPKAKGKKLPRYDWLVLPLCPAHHRLQIDSLDQDVTAWEARHGEQATWIDLLAERYDLPLWELAKGLTE